MSLLAAFGLLGVQQLCSAWVPCATMPLPDQFWRQAWSVPKVSQKSRAPLAGFVQVINLGDEMEFERLAAAAGRHKG